MFVNFACLARYSWIHSERKFFYSYIFYLYWNSIVFFWFASSSLFRPQIVPFLLLNKSDEDHVCLQVLWNMIRYWCYALWTCGTSWKDTFFSCLYLKRYTPNASLSLSDFLFSSLLHVILLLDQSIIQTVVLVSLSLVSSFISCYPLIQVSFYK